MDTASFVAKVRKSIGQADGRFGVKVYISSLWEACKTQFPGRDMDWFKGKLIEAHLGGYLRLSRADLVQVMDQAKLRESETRYGVSEFHFVEA